MQPNAVIYARYSSSNQKEISIGGDSFASVTHTPNVVVIMLSENTLIALNLEQRTIDLSFNE